MTTTTTDYRALDEDTTFTATRTIRGAVHELGTIEPGATVMFRRQAPQDGAGWVLAYTTGEPTNGSEYRVLADWQSVRAFVEGTGLVRVPSTVECAYCGADVPEATSEIVPRSSDDEAWAQRATEHAADCEWIATRAHQLDTPRAD